MKDSVGLPRVIDSLSVECAHALLKMFRNKEVQRSRCLLTAVAPIRVRYAPHPTCPRTSRWRGDRRRSTAWWRSAPTPGAGGVRPGDSDIPDLGTRDHGLGDLVDVVNSMEPT